MPISYNSEVISLLFPVVTIIHFFFSKFIYIGYDLMQLSRNISYVIITGSNVRQTGRRFND